MNKIKKIIVTFFLINFTFLANADQTPNSFADLAEKLMPSVVFISTTTTKIVNQMDPSFPFKFPPGSPFEDLFKDFGIPKEKKGGALGSGFIIDENGTVITNNHVIERAEEIKVVLFDKREVPATIVATDPLSDIAVIQIDLDTLQEVNPGNSTNLQISCFKKIFILSKFTSTEPG